MIVPRTRLLFWTALLVVPFAYFVGAVHEYAAVSLVVLLAFALVVGIDAARAMGALDGVRLELPPLIRMSKDQDTELLFDLVNEKGLPRLLRLGLALPDAIHAVSREMTVTLDAGTEKGVVAWPCRPLRRGSYPLATLYLEAASPLGLWSFRRAAPLATELRVYPNLRLERRNLAALFLNRGAFGMHAQRQIGKGRDFEKLRAYTPGDSFEDIHWKATAKRGVPVTKVYQIERTQEVYVIIDASRLSARTVRLQIDPSDLTGLDPMLAEASQAGDAASGATRIKAIPSMPQSLANPGTESADGQGDAGEGSDSAANYVEATELERFVTAALVMGLVAEKQGDLFGVMAFSDTVRQFVRARNGRAHYSACRDALYALQPSADSPDFNEVCSFIRLRLRRRALILFLTNLDDPVQAENFQRNIKLISNHHLVLVNMLRPPGVQPLFKDPDVKTVDDVYAQLGGHLQWQTLREVESNLRQQGVGFNLLDNERMSTALVSQYLNVKQRQLI